MSLLKKLFGDGKKNKPPTPQEAIQRLREVEQMLTKKSEFLEKKIDAEIAIARKNGTKNKRVALQALKRKKRYEQQLKQIDDTLTTIEFQREALENASTSTEVLTVMGIAARALKSAHNDLDVDKVHDLMDDLAEQQDIAREISEAISNPGGFVTDFDDDDLLAELNELEQEDLDRQLLQIPGSAIDLPSVPTAEPRAAKGRVIEDDDMRELAIDVDKVHDLMDDVAEQQDIAREISEAISNPGGFVTDFDDDDLLAELNELEQEDLDRQLLQIPGSAIDLPSVPTAEPRAAKGRVIEDDDMRELAIDVDKVHDLMDDVAEQQDIAREISEAISNPGGFVTDFDDDDLLAELNELEQEDLDRQLLQIPGSAIDLPSVPTAEPRAAKGRVIEDDDMRELAMWAS